MTGQLHLTFSYQGGTEVGELPVVVDVAHSNLEPAVPPRSVRMGHGWRQRLAPGTYLARIHAPSGHVVRQSCTVHDGEETRANIDVNALSGHESFERSAFLRPFVRDETGPGFAGAGFASTWIGRWHGEAGRRWTQMDFDGSAQGRDDDHTVHYQFQPDWGSQLLQLGGPAISWRFVTLPPRSRVDVIVSARGESDLDIEVTTQSTDAEALLGYLRSGAVDGAQAMAESLLRQKMDDPIAAAIGGYYLLRTGRLNRLSDWAPNLSERFPWLPDGAVINAWQHLHNGRQDRNHADRHFARARQQLLLTAQRGIPVYTEGLKLLLDGLRLMRADVGGEDLELDVALAFVEPYALAADGSSATVTYGGENPGEPRPVSHTGVPKHRRQGLVLLQQVRLQDLVQLGWLVPGSRLESSEWSGKAMATVTPAGQLNVAGKGMFDTPESTAQEVLGLENPEEGWLAWRLTSGSELAPRAKAASQRLDLGEEPTLSDLRWAARGGISPRPNRAKKTMDKAELIDVLARKLGTDRREATAVVENVVDTIVRAVHKGDSVTITGFGVFEQRRRAARVVRNPRTGETVRMKPTSVPAFRPGSQFKAVVSGAQRLPTEVPAVKRAASGGATKKSAKKVAKSAKKAAKKASVRKSTTKWAVAKKTGTTKTIAKVLPAKKTATKAAVKKTAAKKTAAKRTAAAAKKTAVKKTTKGAKKGASGRGRTGA